MDVYQLSREQLTELKQNYLAQLADEGTYAEILGVGYDFPSWYDCANADEIVPDDTVFRTYEGVLFVNDDFFCTAS